MDKTQSVRQRRFRAVANHREKALTRAETATFASAVEVGIGAVFIGGLVLLFESLGR